MNCAYSVLQGNFTYSPGYLSNNIIHTCNSPASKQSLIKPPLFHGEMFSTWDVVWCRSCTWLTAFFCFSSVWLEWTHSYFAHVKSQRLHIFTDIEYNLLLSLSVVALSSSQHNATSQNSDKPGLLSRHVSENLSVFKSKPASRRCVGFLQRVN